MVRLRRSPVEAGDRDAVGGSGHSGLIAGRGAKLNRSALPHCRSRSPLSYYGGVVQADGARTGKSEMVARPVRAVWAAGLERDPRWVRPSDDDLGLDMPFAWTS